MESKFNLKISSRLFKADTRKDKQGNMFIKSCIKAKDGSWIEVESYPDNPMGITAILDLAIQVHSGKVMLKGIANDQKRICRK